MRNPRFALLSLLTLAAFGSAVAETYNIPKNTKVPAVLLTAIDSKTVRVGDKVKANSLSDDPSIFPEGTVFAGYVTEFTPKTKKSSAKLVFSFTKAVLPGGQAVKIEGMPVDTGIKSDKGRTSTDATTGAGIGAAAGVLLNKNKGSGAIIGGLIGGAVGAATSKPREVVIKAGKNFNVLLVKAVSYKAP